MLVTKIIILFLFFFRRYFLIHVSDYNTKYHTLCSMARKLYLFIDDKCSQESVDSLSMHEVNLGGHTMLQYVKEKIAEFLLSMKILTRFKYKESGRGYHITDG